MTEKPTKETRKGRPPMNDGRGQKPSQENWPPKVIPEGGGATVFMEARKGRPPVNDDRLRFSCSLPPDLDAEVRREVTEKVISRHRVPTPDGKDRPYDAGDTIAAALRLYFSQKKPKR